MGVTGMFTAASSGMAVPAPVTLHSVTYARVVNGLLLTSDPAPGLPNVRAGLNERGAAFGNTGSSRFQKSENSTGLAPA